MSDYPPLRPLFPILGLLAGAGCAAVGVVTGESVVFLGTFVFGIVVFVPMARLARSYRGYFVYWRSLAETAKERNRERRATIAASRSGAVVLATLGLVAALSAIPFGLRAEVIRGADLTDPGIAFTVYNRLAAPKLAELIDLYVERDLPLEQTDSADLRILRNLYFAVEGYDFDSEDLRNLFDPLVWYRPYRSYPNDLNALPDSYREDVARILAVEQLR